MPQGRRKTPFSGKAKKAQIVAKRERKEEESTSRVQHERFPKREEETPSASKMSTEDRAAILLDVQLPGKATAHRYDLVRILSHVLVHQRLSSIA